MTDSNRRYRPLTLSSLLANSVNNASATGAITVILAIALVTGIFMSVFPSTFALILYEAADTESVAKVTRSGVIIAFGALSYNAVLIVLRYLLTGVVNPFKNVVESKSSPIDYYVFPTVDCRSDTVSTNTLNRLMRESSSQNVKANTNLFIGIVLAALSMGILSTAILFPPNTQGIPPLYSYASRVALSVTASIFAIFFLSTYRRNLSEIKYFQNEITNFEARVLALKLFGEFEFADRSKSDQYLLTMIERLSGTERNFILKKGETTTDLHQKDLDRQEQVALLAALAAAASPKTELPPNSTRRSSTKPAA